MNAVSTYALPDFWTPKTPDPNNPRLQDSKTSRLPDSRLPDSRLQTVLDLSPAPGTKLTVCEVDSIAFVDHVPLDVAEF